MANQSDEDEKRLEAELLFLPLFLAFGVPANEDLVTAIAKMEAYKCKRERREE